jgi:hypothetical protein
MQIHKQEALRFLRFSVWVRRYMRTGYVTFPSHLFLRAGNVEIFATIYIGGDTIRTERRRSTYFEHFKVYFHFLTEISELFKTRTYL